MAGGKVDKAVDIMISQSFPAWMTVHARQRDTEHRIEPILSTSPPCAKPSLLRIGRQNQS